MFRFVFHAPLYYHPHPSFGKKHKRKTLQLMITFCLCNRVAQFLYSIIVISCERAFCLKIKKSPKSFSFEHHFLFPTNHFASIFLTTSLFVTKQVELSSVASEPVIPVIHGKTQTGDPTRSAVSFNLLLGVLLFPFCFGELILQQHGDG